MARVVSRQQGASPYQHYLVALCHIDDVHLAPYGTVAVSALSYAPRLAFRTVQTSRPLSAW